MARLVRLVRLARRQAGAVAAVLALELWLVAPGAPAPDPVAVASAGGRPAWRR